MRKTMVLIAIWSLFTVLFTGRAAAQTLPASPTPGATLPLPSPLTTGADNASDLRNGQWALQVGNGTPFLVRPLNLPRTSIEFEGLGMATYRVFDPSSENYAVPMLKGTPFTVEVPRAPPEGDAAHPGRGRLLSRHGCRHHGTGARHREI